MHLALQNAIIYGPVNSRRLGLSLGINILPPGLKACPFDCLYCQYGWTEVHLAGADRRQLNWPDVEEVRSALVCALRTLAHQGIRPAYLTLSGNGEPTLHPEFSRLVEAVQAVKDRQIPQAKTAILSNSALVTRRTVRDSLLRLDLRIMKLDCGTEKFFARFNRPCPDISLEGITNGLEDLSRRAPLTIQTLVAAGKGGNFDRRNIREWASRINRIRPSNVQVYTLDRSSPSPTLRPVSADRLQQVRGACEKEGVPAEVYIGEKKR